MGYSTTFDGVLRTDKPISEETARRLQTLADTDTRDLPDYRGTGFFSSNYPGFHCDFEPTPDRCGIRWNGSEKTYDAVEWIQYIIDNYLRPEGITLSGDLNASGEALGDIWKLRVQDNRATKIEARIVFEDA